MKKTFKKALSVLLSLLMLLSVFGGLTLPARAAEPTDWASSNSLPDASGSYVLTSDIALSDPWYPIDGITIDLNGHKITSSGNYDHFIVVQNGITFTLNDSKKDSTDPADKHYYNISSNKAVLSDSETGNYFIGGCLYGINRPSTSVGGAVYVEAGGNFVMNGGTILGHRYLVDGGGVFVRGKNEDAGLTDGVFTMNGGNIIGNHNRWGAGVYNQGVFNLNGGTIRQNYSDWGGGAVLNHGTINMNGGTISENGSVGVAGICVFIGTLNLNGGAIINNSSSRDEGGVGGGAEKNISGNPIVSGNTSRGSASNLTPSGDRPITITGPLTCSEPIHITTNADVSSGNPVVLTAGWDDYMGDADFNDYFVLDNGSYQFVKNPADEIQIVDPSLTYYTASFVPGEGSGTMNGIYAANVQLPENGFTAPADKVFTGWVSSADDVKYAVGASVALNGDTTFTAQWAVPVHASFEPGEADGETIVNDDVPPGTVFALPANPYTAPAGMLFNGWSDGENIYQPGYNYTLNETTTFTAQWVTGVNVTFDSNGGSAVASQLIYPNTAASQPAVPTKAGCTFKGWRLDGEYFDFSTLLSEDITLYAVWVEGTEIGESFENNSTPAGWTAEYGWRFEVSENNGSEDVQPHSGEYMAYHTYYNPSRLTMPAVDLSGQSAVTLSFWYQNCYYNNRDEDHLVVSCRVNGGEWVELFRTTEEHKTWTQATVALPAEALTANVEIGFYADVNGGWGVFLDDVSLARDSGHNLAFSAEGNVLTAACFNDICAWETHMLSLALNAPEKAVYGDENSEFATLTDLGRFNVELGLSVSENDIRYYQGETLLEAAPTNAGDYTAKLTVTVDGTDYTIEKAYSIAKATPSPELPTGLAATYGDTLADVMLPEGWTWDDELTTPVGNAGDNVFAATFTPEDTDNYVTVPADLTVAVAKATPEYEIPTGLTALYGKTLTDVELPEGWAWDAPETGVGCLGDHAYSATFTPEDTYNYNTVTETLTVNVYTNFTFVPAKAPTCTRAGNTAYYNDRNRHYYVVNEANELVEIELYTTVIPAPGHTYGTEGDARFTCTVCGYVDAQRKADAEYEDMLPYYLDEFGKCKEEVKAMCDSRAMSGDSAACAALIAKAKSDIDGLAWDRSKTLEQNKSAVTAILNRLNGELAQQRAADRAGACPYCGANHNGSFIGIFHVFLYKLEKFFSTLFGMGR